MARVSRSSPSLRIVVLSNTDFVAMRPEEQGFSASADVANAARGVVAGLKARGHRAEAWGVDFPTIGEVIEAIAADPPDLVFNLCESLRADSRHEVVVPALLDLADVP